MSYKLGNWDPYKIRKKAQESSLSPEVLNVIIDGDEVCSQIRDAVIALKTKYPEKSEMEICDAVSTAVGQLTVGGYGDVETTIEEGEKYLLEED